MLFFLAFVSFTESRVQTENTGPSLTGPLCSLSAPRALIVLPRVHFCLCCELWPCKDSSPAPSALHYAQASSILFLFVCWLLLVWDIWVCADNKEDNTQMRPQELILDSNHYTRKTFTWKTFSLNSIKICVTFLSPGHFSYSATKNLSLFLSYLS